ncbi:MAG: PIN domain-containing protein [Terriglobales bacterium]
MIAIERGTLGVEVLLSLGAASEAAISAVSASELLHGVYRARPGAQRQRRLAFAEELLAQFPVLAFDLTVARGHAALGASLARRGVVIGAHDLLIAATALARGCTIVTRDKRSFPKIPGLKVELI